MFSLKKRNLRGDLTYVYKYLIETSKEDRARLFSLVPRKMTGTN